MCFTFVSIRAIIRISFRGIAHYMQYAGIHRHCVEAAPGVIRPRKPSQPETQEQACGASADDAS